MTITYQYWGTSKFRDYMDAGPNRSIRHLTYDYNDSKGGGSTPSCSRMVVA